MDQRVPVREVQGSAALAHQVEHLGRRERPLGPQQVSHVVPVDVTHRDVEQVHVRAHVVDGDHVRMGEGRGDPGFLEEPGTEQVIGGDLGREHLECDRAAQPWVLGAVDDAHPAAAQHTHEPVSGELVPNERHRRHGLTFQPIPRLSAKARPQMTPDLRVCFCTAILHATSDAR